MSLSLKQVHELSEEALQERKKQRNVQVDDLVSKSVPFDVVEAGLRKLIMAHPENKIRDSGTTKTKQTTELRPCPECGMLLSQTGVCDFC